MYQTLGPGASGHVADAGAGAPPVLAVADAGAIV